MSNKPESADDNSIELELLSKEKVEGMLQREKIQYIIDSAKSGTILVVEGGITSEDESKLVEQTMHSINPDDENGFSGIEIERYPPKDDSGLLGRLVGSSDDTGLVVIAPADKLKTVEKNRDVIKTLAKAGE